MACDIHWVLEEKTDKGWLGLMSSETTDFEAGNRWYSFFAELGLLSRSESDTAAILIGFPTDASELSVYDFLTWSCTAHSASYLSLTDYVAAYNRALSRYCPAQEPINASKLFGNWFQDYATDEYRVVFWFDN